MKSCIVIIKDIESEDKNKLLYKHLIFRALRQMPHLIIFIISVIVLGVCLDASFSAKDDELSERDVAVLCGASEDYEKNKEQCNKLYDMLEEGEIKDDPDFEYD